MTINNFSTGRDVTLTVTLPSGGGTLSFPSSAVTDFSADPVLKEIDSKGIDGNSRFGYIPGGWKGTIKMDRLNHTVDDYWAQLEAAYYSGTAIQAATITEIIQEQDGTTTQWQYDGVVLKLEKAGDWNADKKVEQDIAFMASHKTKIS